MLTINICSANELSFSGFFQRYKIRISRCGNKKINESSYNTRRKSSKQGHGFDKLHC